MADPRVKVSKPLDPDQDQRALTHIAALEQTHDVLNKVAAGLRAATINKMLFDERETAIILGVSGETLKLWRREGRGPAWVRLGNSKVVRYTIDALRDYVAALQPEQAVLPVGAA
jgi:hypothetical protein